MRSLPNKLMVFGLGLAALSGAGFASAAGPNDPIGLTSSSTRACFLVQHVDSFAARGSTGVNLRVHNDVYQADFIGHCFEIEDSTQISVRTKSGSSFVCNGLDAELVAYSRLTRPQHCQINAIRKLSEAEIKALPKQEKP